jgi:hypothetical protein
LRSVRLLLGLERERKPGPSFSAYANRRADRRIGWSVPVRRTVVKRKDVTKAALFESIT